MHESNTYLPDSEYHQLIETLRHFSLLILFSFVRAPATTRDVIIRNFIARTTACLDSTLRLWPERRYADCWVLLRVMADRLFHLHALAERGDWELFRDWSFIRQYEADQRAFSDPIMGAKARATLTKPTSGQKLRYRELKAKNLRWNRPKAEEVAKALEMPFLYWHTNAGPSDGN